MRPDSAEDITPDVIETWRDDIRDQLQGLFLDSSAFATPIMDKTTVGREHIIVGVDNTGVLFIKSSDGTARTLLNTGINLVNDVLIRLTFTKGTSITVRADNSALQSVTTNLPTKIAGHAIARGTATAGNQAARTMGGYWGFTKV